jgi:predicted HTH domain antitoxin
VIEQEINISLRFKLATGDVTLNEIVSRLRELSEGIDPVKALLAQGSVSPEKAAQIAGYSGRSFSEILLKKGVSPITFDDENVAEDIRNA